MLVLALVTYAASHTTVAPFSWGPYILAAIGIVTGIGGFFIRRLVVALDESVKSLSKVEQEIAVVRTVITSGIEARLTNLENERNRT